MSMFNLISDTRIILRKAKVNSSGIILLEGRNCLDIRISKDSITRCLKFFEEMSAILQEDGFTLETKSNENKAPSSFLRRGEERIQFHFEEELTATPHVLSKEEERKLARKNFLYGRFANYPDEIHLLHWWPPKFDYHPSGKLSFKIDNGYSGLRKRWSEKADKTLNDLLPKILVGITKVADYLRDQEIEWARREKEKEEAWRAEHRREQEGLLRENRVQHLQYLLKKWSERKRILDFLGDIEKQMPGSGRTPIFHAWRNWVSAYVDELAFIEERDLKANENGFYDMEQI